MKPDFETEKIKLYRANCMDLMCETPDKAFDLAIVDPPYGIKQGGESAKNGTSVGVKSYYKKHDWDLVRPNSEYFKELFRVSKNQIIWGGNYFSDLLPPFRCFISWDKTIHGNSYADCELAWTSFNQVARYYRENIAETNSDGRIHPTQKSVAIYSWLLSKYAKHGQTILDTHLGSMSIVIACHRAAYNITGCELDADYFRDGVARVQRELDQPFLALSRTEQPKQEEML